MGHTLRSTVYGAIGGDVIAAFQKLGENVQEHENPREEAAETYLTLSPEERSKTRVLTLTNKARADINLAIRGGLKSEGQIEAVDLKYSGLDNLRLTDAERVDARNYSAGNVLQ